MSREESVQTQHEPLPALAYERPESEQEAVVQARIVSQSVGKTMLRYVCEVCLVTWSSPDEPLCWVCNKPGTTRGDPYTVI